MCMCFFFNSGVVEYDAEGFTKLTLLLMWKDFCFLVHSEQLFAMGTNVQLLEDKNIQKGKNQFQEHLKVFAYFHFMFMYSSCGSNIYKIPTAV